MKLNVSFIKSVLNLYSELLGNGISIVYLGDFSHEITRMFTSMTETKMDKKSEKRKVKMRVYHAMVETLQNINKHSDEIWEDDNIGGGLFMIGNKDDTYYVITSNKIHVSKIDGLRSAIDEVNNATPEELKAMHKKQMREGRISNKGGAGLGLIDIRKRTGSMLEYHFIPNDEETQIFIFKVEINAEKIPETKSKTKPIIKKEEEN